MPNVSMPNVSMLSMPNVSLRKLAALCLAAALAAACTTRDGPFAPVGDPKHPLYEARALCKEKHRSVSDDGSATIDWDAYERCMADLGWVKQIPSSQPAAPAMGGGGAGY